MLVAVIGVAVGVIAAAPWSNPPVLRPTGRITDSASISSIAFRWAGPTTGPAPAKYEILRNGRQIGSVPGNVTFYRASGLVPDTAYRFEVAAIRGGKTSPHSAELTSHPHTRAGAAVLNWTGTSFYKTIASLRRNGGWSIGAIGHQWNDSWTFTLLCVDGPGNVTLYGSIDGTQFTVPLAARARTAAPHR